MKICSRCLEVKPISGFYTSVTNRGGYQSRCKDCCKTSAKEWKSNNIDLVRTRRNTADREKRRERGLKRQRRTASEAAELHRIQERQRYVEEKGRIKERVANYKKQNAGKVAQYNAKRKAAKLKAAVPWANIALLNAAYELAQTRTADSGFAWHVDHIIPLQHPLVCGLHNEFNIQVIPASVNCSKQNSFDVDA